MPHTGPVTELTIETDPAEVGLDKERLKRIDAHFARYVDDGRLAGLAAHRSAGTAAWRTWPGAGRVTSRRGCR